MNIENIKALADILNSKGLSAIEVGDGENRIRIEKGTQSTQIQVQPASAPAASTTAHTSASLSEETPGTPDVNARPVDINNIIEFKSPLVGVYYAAPSPDAETFVSIGSKVKKGDVLCIIETMKLMNEITSDFDGEIIDICIKNGDIAEFGQVLFKLV